MQEYVEEGTLRIEWRDFPYLGQESVNAAMAARAAQAQGKFWEYHDLLNGRVLAGLQPVGVYENAIEQARREAEGSS